MSAVWPVSSFGSAEPVPSHLFEGLYALSPMAQFHRAALKLLGITKPVDRVREMFQMADLSFSATPAYIQAYEEERSGTAASFDEPIPDFGIDYHVKHRIIPDTKVTSEILRGSSFTRILSFDRRRQSKDIPTFVIVAPNSGTSAQQMHDTVLAFLNIGNVRLVEQRDPHYVDRAIPNGLDDQTDDLIQVLIKNPGAHVIGISQSGIPATVATAYLFQNEGFDKAHPKSLTIIGSPINAELDPDTLEMASHTIGEPLYIPVGPRYPGAGRRILPGNIPELYFHGSKNRDNLVRRAMTETHISDTLKRVFREFWLAKGRYYFRAERIKPEAITCPVIAIGGSSDVICPPKQTHDLLRLTPNAVSQDKVTLEGVTHYGLIEDNALVNQIVPVVARSIGLQPRPV